MTDSPDTLFGEVRAILAGPASAQTWELLCSTLERVGWTPSLEESLLPYVHSHLSAWPDALRVAPRRWTHQRSLSKYAPLLALSRSLVIHNSTLSDTGLTKLLACWGERHTLTHIDLEDCRKLSNEGAAALADSSHAAHIVHLNLNLCGIHEAGFHALGASLNGPLQYVDMSYNSPRQGALRDWIHSGAFDLAHTILMRHCGVSQQETVMLCAHLCHPGSTIRTLDLAGAMLDDDAAEELARLPWPSTLETLDLSYTSLTQRGTRALTSASSRLPRSVDLHLPSSGL